MIECCMCGKRGDARAMEKCAVCGMPLCRECAGRENGVCESCAEDENRRV